MVRNYESEQLKITDASFKETPQDQIDLEEAAEATEQAFLDEFGINDTINEYYARVYRVTNGRKSFLEQVGPDKFPIEERLQALHKGGHFEIMLFKNGKIWKNKTYRVEPPPHAPLPERASDISEIGRLIAMQNEQMANLLARANPTLATPPAPVDPMQMFAAMMGAISQAKEIFTQPAQPKSDIKEFIEILSVAKDLVGDNGGGKGVVDLLSDLVKSPIAGEIADQFRAERQRPNPSLSGPTVPLLRAGPVPALNPSPVEPAPASPGAPVPAILAALSPQMTAQLKQQVDYWVTRAARDSDPALYAELLMDNMEPAIIQALVFDPELEAAIAYLNPQSTQYVEWFQEFISVLVNILTEEQEPGINQGEAALAPDVPSGKRSAPTVNIDGDTGRTGGRPGNAGNYESLDNRGKEKPKRAPKGGAADKRVATKEVAG